MYTKIFEPSRWICKNFILITSIKKTRSKIGNKNKPYITHYFLLPQKRKKAWTKTPLQLLFVAHLAAFTHLYGSSAKPQPFRACNLLPLIEEHKDKFSIKPCQLLSVAISTFSIWVTASALTNTWCTSFSIIQYSRVYLFMDSKSVAKFIRGQKQYQPNTEKQQQKRLI